MPLGPPRLCWWHLAHFQRTEDGTKLPLKSITWVNVFIRISLKLSHQDDTQLFPCDLFLKFYFCVWPKDTIKKIQVLKTKECLSLVGNPTFPLYFTKDNKHHNKKKRKGLVSLRGNDFWEVAQRWSCQKWKNWCGREKGRGERKRKKNYVNSVTYYKIDKHKHLNGKFNVTLSASR